MSKQELFIDYYEGIRGGYAEFQINDQSINNDIDKMKYWQKSSLYYDFLENFTFPPLNDLVGTDWHYAYVELDFNLASKLLEMTTGIIKYSKFSKWLSKNLKSNTYLLVLGI